MARIRTIKPEFWTDDLIGSLTRDQRLLFIASWNLADDEGLLRWSAPFLKGAVFPFDEDISVADVEASMRTLEERGIVFPYLGGRSQQRLAYIVNFHKHQKINRPSPSKLPPPSLQSPEVREMYGERDGHICHLCEKAIDRKFVCEEFMLSIDHIQPVSSGGSDYPSNVRASHQTCNKGRGNRTVEEYKSLISNKKTASQARYPDRLNEDSLNNSLNRSRNDSAQEGEGDGEGDLDQETQSLRSCDLAQAQAPAPKTKGPPSDKKPKKAKVERVFTPISSDAVPNERQLADAREMGFTREQIWALWCACRDHHVAKDSRFKDWEAAWRTWMRNSLEFRRQRGPVIAPAAKASGDGVDQLSRAISDELRKRRELRDGNSALQTIGGSSAANADGPLEIGQTPAFKINAGESAGSAVRAGQVIDLSAVRPVGSG
jgi:5-methylcytosine-specific restriction endonuclease McrA